MYYALDNSCSDLGMEEDEEEAIPLPNVNAAILKKVIQWCTYHKDDPPPPEDNEDEEKSTDDIGTWDMEFLKVDQGTLFELILVSVLNNKMYYVLYLRWNAVSLGVVFVVKRKCCMLPGCQLPEN